MYQRIEQLIGKKLPLYQVEDEEVMCLQERVSEAQRLAKMVIITNFIVFTSILIHNLCLKLQNMKDMGDKKGKRDLDDDEEGAMGVRKKNIGRHKSNKSKKFKKK